MLAYCSVIMLGGSLHSSTLCELEAEEHRERKERDGVGVRDMGGRA